MIFGRFIKELGINGIFSGYLDEWKSYGKGMGRF